MSKRSLFCLTALVIIIVQSSQCHGCTCVNPPVHIQSAVCQNEFLIKASVKTQDPKQPGYAAYEYDNDGYREYQVKVKHIFKRPANLTMGNKQTIKSGIGEGLCGVLLDVGNTYLLGGHLMHNGDLYLGACSSVIVLWDRLSDTTKHLLHRGKYFNGCDCKIKTCRSKSCLKPASNTCVYDVTSRTSDCYAESTFCKRRQNSKTCKWIKGAELRRCLKKDRLLNATKG